MSERTTDLGDQQGTSAVPRLGASAALLERLRGRVRMTERHAEVTAPTGSAPNAEYHARAVTRLEAYRCCLADAEDPAYADEWPSVSWQRAYAAFAKFPSPPPYGKLRDDACECVEVPPVEGDRGSFREYRVPPQGCLVHGRPVEREPDPVSRRIIAQIEKAFAVGDVRPNTVASSLLRRAVETIHELDRALGRAGRSWPEPLTRIADHPIAGRVEEIVGWTQSTSRSKVPNDWESGNVWVHVRNGRRADGRGWICGKTRDDAKWIVGFVDGEKIAYDERDLDVLPRAKTISSSKEVSP